MILYKNYRNLKSNKLSGLIPSCIGNLTKLEILYLLAFNLM